MSGRLLVGVLLAGMLAYAQRSGGRGSGLNDDMGGAPIQRAPQPTKAQLLADKLKLDREQKEQLQNILMAAAEEAVPLRNQIGNARVQLATALIDSKGDEAVKQAQEAYSSAAAQVASVEAKTFAKIYGILKPNQQSRAIQGFELVARMFEQQGGRARPIGGRGERGERGERER